MTDERLEGLTAHSQVILLDFDGPVCSIFAGLPAHEAADELRTYLTGAIGVHAAELGDTDDPLAILRAVADLGSSSLTQTAADFLRDVEVRAAKSAAPTPHLMGVLVAATETDRRLGVVSNNSMAGVQAFLKRVGLERMFACVVGRYDGMDPRLMKPSDHLVTTALARMDAAPSHTTLVGDSVSDIEAARAAGIRSIGYANKPGKLSALAAAGADAVIESMDELAAALIVTPCRVPPDA